MRRLSWLAIASFALPLAAHAQATANPVVSVAQEIFARQSKFIIAAAEQMPAEKYSYHPTPEQWSFAKITSHIAISSYAVCAMIAGTPAPEGGKISDTDAKDAQVAAVKAAFAFCGQALAHVTDAQMGDPITYFRGAKTSRARALFELTDDLEDHYSQMAGYLRLNGLIPPSAQPPK
jgi:uncharacterized damage-inducible protein DinB